MKSFQQAKVNTFCGRCQLIVSLAGEGGEIKVEATSESLDQAICNVKEVEE